jgi:hypothetical protein
MHKTQQSSTLKQQQQAVTTHTSKPVTTRHDYLKGKSVIYQQENYEKHEPLSKEIMDRLNDNITDKLSRREIFEAVKKFRGANARKGGSALNEIKSGQEAMDKSAQSN